MSDDGDNNRVDCFQLIDDDITDITDMDLDRTNDCITSPFAAPKCFYFFAKKILN